MNKQFFKPDDAEESTCYKTNKDGSYPMEVKFYISIDTANTKIAPLLKQLKEAREIIEMHAKHGSPASKEFLERWKE